MPLSVITSRVYPSVASCFGQCIPYPDIHVVAWEKNKKRRYFTTLMIPHAFKSSILVESISAIILLTFPYQIEEQSLTWH